MRYVMTHVEYISDCKHEVARMRYMYINIYSFTQSSIMDVQSRRNSWGGLNIHMPTCSLKKPGECLHMCALSLLDKCKSLQVLLHRICLVVSWTHA